MGGRVAGGCDVVKVGGPVLLQTEKGGKECY